MPPSSALEIEPGVRVTGERREQLGAELKRRYDAGASIRDIADDINRSYGFVHNVLGESGARLRGRGGNNRAKR